ncbi:M13 family metallopeptidase [Niabella beijingensis]|uniref:M13 family metallopeptidase n=1 Tax=Niabella beijingensis TaxID=2872700 RepID=UPI001CC0D864|nr:M13 family metallopeptidase [Niabella beijingensis]MBZ4189433.1 M13 family metallopeptidase [Niabella beijingensis]
MKNKKRFFVLLLLLPQVLPGQTKIKEKELFIDFAARDTTIPPGEDFFRYANGHWLTHTPIPATETKWGSFYELRDLTLDRLRAVIEKPADQLQEEGIEQKVNDLYRSGMDTLRLEKLGFEPIRRHLLRIASVSNKKALIGEIATALKMGQSAVIRFRADPDEKNSAVITAHFDQAVLGLPSKDYYVKTDAATKQIRRHYADYIAALFSLTGDDPATAKQNAGIVLAMETRLANASRYPAELRIPDSNYYKYAVTTLDQQYPALQWNLLLNALGIRQDSLVLGQPEFYRALNAMVATAPLQHWKILLRFYEIHCNADFLSAAFVQAHFLFYGKELTGQESLKERWKTVLNAIDVNFGEALGRLYVSNYFPPEAKMRMTALVNNLQKTYQERLQTLDWMSDSTRQKAIAKLNAFIKKIGYPDVWTDYGFLKIDRHAYLANIAACRAFEFRKNCAKIGKPTDRTEWHMTPPTIDAYYNAQHNEIVFPAGILQPPFFFMNADDAVNYGAIGTAIGHEMTHGFDDEGRQYDAEGNLRNWWSSGDAARFVQKAQMVIDQYNHSKILDSLPVNGVLTLGENIADIGGLAIAYEAFKKTEQGKGDQRIDGLTPDERFFLSYARIWRIKNTPGTARLRLSTDKHAPEKYRVNNPLSDFTPFYKTFKVQPGQGMYRPEPLRVHIW